MADERTKEEVERLAKEMAQRVMSKPHQPQEWPKKPKPTDPPRGASEPKKRGRAASGTYTAALMK